MYPRLTKTASNSLLEASSIVRVPSSLIRIAPVIHRLLESVGPNSSWSLSKRTVGTVMLIGLVGFDDRRRLILLPPGNIVKKNHKFHPDTNNISTFDKESQSKYSKNSLQTPRTAWNESEISRTKGCVLYILDIIGVILAEIGLLASGTCYTHSTAKRLQVINVWHTF